MNKKLKSFNTETILEDMFIELYKNKSIEEITIKELTTKAGINRGTFYLHYENIYDIRKKIEERILNELEEKAIDKYNKAFSMDIEEMAKFFIPVLEYIDNNKNYLRSLLSNTTDYYFENKLKEIMGKNLGNYFRYRYKNSKETNMYIQQYIVSANMGVIFHWIKNENSFSPYDIALLLSELIHKGALNM